MGYSTEFIGELLFTKELKASEIVKIKSFLGQDCRNHPEWNAKQLTYIDLEFTDDFTGLKWDGSEKTYDLVEKVNLIVDIMKKDYPDFGLKGSLLAQGEDIHDKWMLSIDNNRYEVVGSFLHGNHIKREFNHEDNIIQNFYNYLENPKVIIKKFPKIISYIPKKIRKKLSIQVSESEEEREKDIYHGSKKEESIDI